MMRYRLLDTTLAYILDDSSDDPETNLAVRHATYFRARCSSASCPHLLERGKGVLCIATPFKNRPG
jgi:predicted ATPase